MKIIGITGGIAMGKSAALGMFRRCGVRGISADETVARLMRRGGAAVAMVEKIAPFAVSCGAIDKAALAKAAFETPELLAQLEQILHPLVQREERRFLQSARRRRAKIVTVEIPLLFETGAQRRMDFVVTVSAPRFLQERRARNRPGMTHGRFSAILARQQKDDYRRRHADFVVMTGLGMAFSMRQVKQIVQRIRREGTV